jgi:hypothetical protein
MPVLLPLPRERGTGTDRKFKRPFRSAGRPSPVLPAGGPAVPAALAARLWLVPAGWGMVQSQVFPRAREGERFQTGGGPPCPAPRLGGLATGDATRLGTGYTVETMGAASDSSARACGTATFFRCAPSIVVTRSPLPHDSSEGPITTDEASNMPLQRSLRSSTVHI